MNVLDKIGAIGQEVTDKIADAYKDAKQDISNLFSIRDSKTMKCENALTDLNNKATQATLGTINLSSNQLSLIQNAIKSNNCQKIISADNEINQELSR